MLSPTSLLSTPKKKNNAPKIVGYNDDAFGLVFLGSSLTTQDFAFPGTFLILSAAAATATNLGVWNFSKADPRVPAAVAVVALILTPLVALALEGDQGLQVPPMEDIGVTVASCVWAGFNFQKEKSLV